MRKDFASPDLEASSQSHRTTGWLLVGHGTRDPAGIGEFLATVELVRSRADGIAVEPCFLEFARPTIAEGFRSLAQAGARHIVVVPVLLFSAGHAQEDIPAAVREVAKEFPHVTTAQAEHLGCHGCLLELARERFEAALAERAAVRADDTALIVVGRGSRDEGATAEMRRFVELHGERVPVASAHACFVAMAEPSLETMLAEAAQWPVRRVVVQPHLLFGGLLLDRIAQTVERHAQLHPNIEWIVASHLGPSPRVAEALCERARET